MFHKNAIAVPTDPCDRRKLFAWLHSHPMFQLTVIIKNDFTSNILNKLMFKSEKAHDKAKIVTLSRFRECVSIDLVYVNPDIGATDSDHNKNILPQVWIEAGPLHDQKVNFPDPIDAPPGGWTDHNRYVPSHDYRLDCGGNTLEDAMLNLAVRVEFFYRNNADGKDVVVPERCEFIVIAGSDAYESGCVIGADGYCNICGYEEE